MKDSYKFVETLEEHNTDKILSEFDLETNFQTKGSNVPIRKGNYPSIRLGDQIIRV